ncbi:hypothetical protein PCC82_04610 [Agrobacterium deltaense]
MTEGLTLKWGTVKGWNLNEEGPAFAALKKYYDAGPVSFGVMQQRDTDEQRQALCECIDAVDGEIWNDWEGRAMTKDEAKKYVTEYDRG